MEGFDVNIEDVSGLTKKLTITLPADSVQPRLNDEYDRLKREVKMKGFRRGKIPRSVIVKYYKGQVEGETAEKLVQENYFDIIEKQENLDPITHPDIKDVKYNDDGSFTFIAEIEVRPVFELGQYKGLEIVKEDVAVSDDEVSEELGRMQKSMAPLQVVDRAAQEGDTIIVDFQGYNNGNIMPQVKQENYSVEIGSGNMGEEFESQLTGMTAGDEKSHEIEFPESHPNPLFKGKKVEFKIKANEVKERVLSELNDDFAKLADGAHETLDDLKNAIRDRLTKRREKEVEGATSDKIVEALLTSHEFEVPNKLVAYEIEEMIKQTEQQFQQMGLSLEAAGMSREQLAEQNAEVAAKRVRGDFILKKVAEVEDIKVEDEDLERGFKRIGDMYNMPVARVKEFFKSRDDLLPFMNELLNEKVLTFLRENASFVDAPAEEEQKAE